MDLLKDSRGPKTQFFIKNSKGLKNKIHNNYKRGFFLKNSEVWNLNFQNEY